MLAAFAGVGVGAVSVNASRSVPWQPGHCCSWRRTASTRNQVPVHPHRSQAYVGTHTPSWHNGLPRNYRKAHAGWNATGASGYGFVTNGKRWGRLDAVVHGCGERRSDRSRLRGRLQAPTRLVVNMRRSANPEARAVSRRIDGNGGPRATERSGNSGVLCSQRAASREIIACGIAVGASMSRTGHASARAPDARAETRPAPPVTRSGAR